MTETKPIRPLPKWILWAAIALFFLFASALVVLAFGLNQAEHDQYVTSQQRHASIVQLSKNNDALRAQIQQLGQKPVAPPAATVIKGIDGTNGSNGVNGTNGKDGRGVLSFTCQADGTWLVLYTDETVQSLQGPCVGATGATGAPGATGATGAAGTNGANGANGQPPVSWTFPYTDELGRTTTYTCVRSTPFDPANPTYTCTAN